MVTPIRQLDVRIFLVKYIIEKSFIMSSFIDNFRIREQMRAQDNYQGEGKLRIMPIHEERGAGAD